MKKRFRARIELVGSKLNWRIVNLPFSVKKVFGSAARVPVCGTVNGFPYRTSVFPWGDGRHMLMLNKQVQQGAGVRNQGDMVEVVMEVDTAERTVEVPALLRKTLAEDKQLRKYFDCLNYSARKEIAKWVMEPKSQEARVRRAEQMTERLMLAMEGEREAPPILKAVFAHNPKARVGWEKISPTQKRMQLLAIFGYRSPESRARRVEKLVTIMMEHAEKRRKISD